MRILITNDDGIQAKGLLPLARWAQKLGDVTVVAPKYEQSGKSHSIELHKPFEVKPYALASDIEAYAVDSTPGDCVRFAVLGLHRTFDLVISGMNRGFNIGVDIMYSGTAAAVFEAANLGLPAIALSTDYDTYPAALAHLDVLWDYFVQHDLMARHNVYNVNIPATYKGIRITRQGGAFYSDEFVPQGNDMYMPTGICIFRDSNNDDLDTDAVHHGYISISPLTTGRVDLGMFQHLAGKLNPA